jgi:hypothetical protein
LAEGLLDELDGHRNAIREALLAEPRVSGDRPHQRDANGVATSKGEQGTIRGRQVDKRRPSLTLAFGTGDRASRGRGRPWVMQRGRRKASPDHVRSDSSLDWYFNVADAILGPWTNPLVTVRSSRVIARTACRGTSLLRPIRREDP